MISIYLRGLVVILLLLGGTVYAKTKPLSLTEGKKLKNLKSYRLKDFHLKKKVRYFDLRQYYTTKGYPYMRGWAFDQQAYNKLPSNLRRILQRRDAAKTRNKKGWEWDNYVGTIGAYHAFSGYGDSYKRTISILYFVKPESNIYIWHQNSKKWMKDFLGRSIPLQSWHWCSIPIEVRKDIKRYPKAIR